MLSLVTASEDFAFLAREVPGLFYFIGVAAPESPPGAAAPKHAPRLRSDEVGLLVGLRSLLHIAVDYFDGVGK